MDLEKLKQLRDLLKRLEQAQKDSLKAADAVARNTTPRRGPRGGIATTLDARWSRAAEYRNRLARDASRLAHDLLGPPPEGPEEGLKHEETY